MFFAEDCLVTDATFEDEILKIGKFHMMFWFDLCYNLPLLLSHQHFRSCTPYFELISRKHFLLSFYFQKHTDI